MEVVILVTFVTLQACAKNLPHCISRLEKYRTVQHLADKHWLVWLGHPSIVHGLYDYAVHFIVYSGYVIRAH